MLCGSSRAFENPYAMFPGLNLTFEVREGIVKHSRDFAPGEIPALDEYLPGLQPPLEAQLIDLCDEIAYNTSDLDDGYFAGLVQLEEARRGSGEVPRVGRNPGAAISGSARTGSNARNRARTDQLAGLRADRGDRRGGQETLRMSTRCARMRRAWPVFRPKPPPVASN